MREGPGQFPAARPMNVVATRSGFLRGARESGVQVFRGVSYAAAPIGSRRWRRPQPPESWTGVRDALEFGPIAPQPTTRARLERAGLRMSEDCLSLNIWTPRADDLQRPVMVFVHGGGLVSGSGAHPLSNGATLSRRGGVVVVTINYRLGALATSYAPEILGTPDDPATNLAVHDIAAALRWVRDNVAAFGGDAENITAFGQSSGAIALSCLMATPAMHGVFDKLILQSGGLERVMTEDESRGVTRKFIDALELAPGADPRQLPLDKVLAAQSIALADRRKMPPLGEFHPAVDGRLPPRHPLLAAPDGTTAPIPMLVGATRDEWRMMDAGLSDDQFVLERVRERARSLLGGRRAADEIIEIYRADRARDGQGTDLRGIAAAMVTDYHFRVPSELFALGHAEHDRSTFHYVLEWESPTPGLRACHGICIPLVFGTTAAGERLCGDGNEARAMSTALQDAWVAFARHGHPGTPTVGDWPQFTPARRETMCVGPRPRLLRNARADIFALWSDNFRKQRA